MLREALESDLISYIETRLSTSGSKTTSECFVYADTTNHSSVLKRSHGFINPFDCIVNIPFKTVLIKKFFVQSEKSGKVSYLVQRCVLFIYSRTAKQSLCISPSVDSARKS